jgi:hypothetical protein
MNVTFRVVCALLVFTFPCISFAQQCPPGYPITVSPASVSPSAVNGDGAEVAQGHFQVHNSVNSSNVLILFAKPRIG